MTRAMAARNGARSSPNCKARAFQMQQLRVGSVISCFAGYVGSALDGNKKRKGKSGRTQGWQPAPPRAGTLSEATWLPPDSADLEARGRRGKQTAHRRLKALPRLPSGCVRESNRGSPTWAQSEPSGYADDAHLQRRVTPRRSEELGPHTRARPMYTWNLLSRARATPSTRNSSQPFGPRVGCCRPSFPSRAARGV